MKKACLLFVLLISFGAAHAQNEVMLHLAPRLGSNLFSLNQPVNHPSGNYQLKFTRFEFYIAEIKITHDGGQVTPCPDLYLLVHPAIDSMYSLGQMADVQNVESITFSVGVPSTVNHLDPASYPSGHPLAPQNPSMQWGWSAGYRFAAIEGVAGTNFSQTFEIHALGDANYKTQTLPAYAEQVNPEMKMIHITADYTDVLKNITVSGGLIVHGAGGAAVTLLNNFKNLVFTAETSGVTDPAFSGSFSVSPNPAKGVLPQVNLTLPDGGDYRLTVTDIIGKVLYDKVFASVINQSLSLVEMTEPGLYFVQLWQNDKPVAVEKLVVLE